MRTQVTQESIEEKLLMGLKKSIHCQFCDQQAAILKGKDSITKWPSWTRYGCGNGHKFAVPTHTVELRNAA